MKEVFKNHVPYLICLALFFTVGGTLIYLFDMGFIEMYVNRLHQPYYDSFFKYYTMVGDGIFITIVIIVLMLYRFYYGFLCLVAILIKTAIVQYLKLVVFHYTPRPKMFFKGQDFYLVEGVEVHGFNSFPSGHSSQAFCMATILALIVSIEVLKNGGLIQIGIFLVALIVGVSRLYLMQHFVEDIVAGAAIGCFIAYITYIIFELLPFKNSAFFNKSILNLRSR